jgi:hypothetical protein
VQEARQKLRKLNESLGASRKEAAVLVFIEVFLLSRDIYLLSRSIFLWSLDLSLVLVF